MKRVTKCVSTGRRGLRLVEKATLDLQAIRNGRYLARLHKSAVVSDGRPVLAVSGRHQQAPAVKVVIRAVLARKRISW